MGRKKFILALDQGTTSSRAIIFDHSGEIRSLAQKEFRQLYPKPGWVEHSPDEIWTSQREVIKQSLSISGISASELVAIGITNQRETTIVWDRITGKPIYNAIVWQDRRTSNYCENLKGRGYEDLIREKTGLIIDPYFSATKISWILDNIKGVRKKAENGEICFGTIDSWLVWKLTGGKTHITDISNASRTMLFNISSLEWDEELLKIFNIPRAILPEVKSSSEQFASGFDDCLGYPVPITGIAGDQQAALFGQLCLEKGMAKNTYGTGCFMVMNTGSEPVLSNNKLLTTIAWKFDGKVNYALEGSVFIAGAVIQWLRDGLGIIESAKETEELARSIPDNGGIYFVPALTGLGAPYWDPYARGSIYGITRGTTKVHLCRAALESIAYQVYDVVKVMEEDLSHLMKELRADGGAVKNNFLMQFQSDILGKNVIRPKILETTALGAAYLSGLAVGFWKDLKDIKAQWKPDKIFIPEMKPEEAEKILEKWGMAVLRSKGWAT